MTLDFVLGRVWPRDGLSHCQRLLVTLACTCDEAAPGAVDAHMDGAPAGGDLTPYELVELVGRIAVSCEWPSTSQAEGSLRAQLVRLSEERGGRVGPLPELSIESLGPGDLAVLLAGGERCLEDVDSGQHRPGTTAPPGWDPQPRVRSRAAAAKPRSYRASAGTSLCVGLSARSCRSALTMARPLGRVTSRPLGWTRSSSSSLPTTVAPRARYCTSSQRRGGVDMAPSP